MAEHMDLGGDGELYAALYLRSCGWEIVATNWYFDGGEIDLIASRRELRYGQWVEVLLFVEVKTRQHQTSYTPEMAVGHAKRQRMIRGATLFLKTYGDEQVSVQFDVVALVGASGRYQMRHQKHAFDASGETLG